MITRRCFYTVTPQRDPNPERPDKRVPYGMDHAPSRTASLALHAQLSRALLLLSLILTP
jgi:hypothetical protein